MSPLHKIVGMEVQAIEPVQDYWQIVLSAACVNAYSPIELSHPAAQLLGMVVSEVQLQEEKSLNLVLSQDKCISISLRPEQFTGPEALSIHFASGQILAG